MIYFNHNLTIIGSVNSLSPGPRRTIIWTNTAILLIRTLGTDIGEILGEFYKFPFRKMHLKIHALNGGTFFSASVC